MTFSTFVFGYFQTPMAIVLQFRMHWTFRFLKNLVACAYLSRSLNNDAVQPPKMSPLPPLPALGSPMAHTDRKLSHALLHLVSGSQSTLDSMLTVHQDVECDGCGVDSKKIFLLTKEIVYRLQLLFACSGIRGMSEQLKRATANAQSKTSGTAGVKDVLVNTVSVTAKNAFSGAAASKERSEASIPEETATVTAGASDVESDSSKDSESMRDLHDTVSSLETRVQTMMKRVSDMESPTEALEKLAASLSDVVKPLPAEEWTHLNVEDIEGKSSNTEAVTKEFASLSAVNASATPKTVSGNVNAN